MGDVEILNFALTLEYLESAFYAEGLKRAGADRRPRRNCITHDRRPTRTRTSTP